MQESDYAYSGIARVKGNEHGPRGNERHTQKDRVIYPPPSDPVSARMTSFGRTTFVCYYAFFFFFFFFSGTCLHLSEGVLGMVLAFSFACFLFSLFGSWARGNREGREREREH